jgi:hypothetical protein
VRVLVKLIKFNGPAIRMTNIAVTTKMMNAAAHADVARDET